jgi:hypothetical protein
MRVKRFKGVLHRPAEVISGFTQNKLSLQEAGMIGKRIASCLDGSTRRWWGKRGEAKFIFCEDVSAGSRIHQQIQRARNTLEMAKICDKSVAFHSSDFMIAGQTRGDKQESKSSLRRRLVNWDSSFQLDRRGPRTSPDNLFHRHIFETALEMRGSKRGSKMLIRKRRWKHGFEMPLLEIQVSKPKV